MLLTNFLYAENSELGDRFKVSKDDFPAVFLFVKDNKKGIEKLEKKSLQIKQNIITYLICYLFIQRMPYEKLENRKLVQC